MSLLLLLDDGPLDLRSLFASGEQGIWLDPSDFSTLYQDAAGTTPVTAVGQPVGLALDKRLGLALGPELKGGGTVGLVGTATAATYDTTTGAGAVTRVDGANQSFVNFTATINSFYQMRISVASGTVQVRAGTYAGTVQAIVTAGTTVTVTVPCLAGSVIALNTPSGTATFTVSSVRELPGNHAYQTTGASRPTLQQDSNGMYYLSFDGTDDSMIAGAASTFNFLHNNLGATVFCGYMPSGTSVYHTIVATGNLGNAGVVGFTLSQDDRTVGVTNNIIANGSGSLFVNSNPTTGVTASKRVVSVVNASGKHITRKNAVQISAATETGSASLANSTYVLNIGRTGAGLAPLKGRIYQLIIRGAASNDGQIAAGEAYVNAKTMAYA